MGHKRKGAKAPKRARAGKPKKAAKRARPATRDEAGERDEVLAVVGAGTMGHGIAQAAALAGYRVVLHDVSEPALEAAMKRIRATLNEGVKREKVARADATAALRRIRLTTLLAEAVRDAEIVVEAVPEERDLKRQLFRDLDRATRSSAVLASNTSSIRIAELAEGLDHPNRVVGLHFFNPVHILALVEVVRGPESSQYAVEAAIAVARRLGKTPVLVQDTPGFASTRLGVLLGLEAMRMVEEGVATPHAIDTAMELGYRHPMGPLKLSDLIGLDVRLAIAEYLHRELGAAHYRPPEILRRLVSQGKLGRKSGEGFYGWGEDGPQPRANP